MPATQDPNDTTPPKPPKKRAKATPPAGSEPKPRAPRKAADPAKQRQPPGEETRRLASALTSARTLAHMSRAELAAQSGISATKIATMEQATVAWSVERLTAVARALNLDPAHLLVAAGLSAGTGTTEQAIQSDPRLSSLYRRVLLDQLANFVELHAAAIGSDQSGQPLNPRQ